MNDSPRYTFSYKVKHALANPGRVIPHAKRLLRNQRLRRTAPNFSQFYRGVMADFARRDPNLAVGSYSIEHWNQFGELQFDYLVKHGLEPSHRILDIGCGNLRAGWRLIDYLDEGHYVGVDLSPDILFSAESVLAERGLQDKRPYLYVIDGMNLDFLPSASFDVMHAHSVFSHTPISVLDRYVEQAERLLVPDGFFDFSYNEGDKETSFAEEDFYYRSADVLDVVKRHGFEPERMPDWDHPQVKIRLRRPTGVDEADTTG